MSWSQGSVCLVLMVFANVHTVSGQEAGGVDGYGGEPALVDEWMLTGDGFEGTFLQPQTKHKGWDDERWRSAFRSMRRLGMRTLLVQWTEYGDFTLVESGPDPYAKVKQIARLADEFQLEVYFGLSLNPSWWNNGEVDSNLLSDDLAANRGLADGLYSALKPYRSFRGWYIPHEVTDIGFSEGQWTQILDFFRRLTGHLNQLDPTKAVAASGYTDANSADPSIFRRRLGRFQISTGIDTFIFQDGASRERYRRWQLVIPLLEILTNEQKSGRLWLLGEVFTQTAGEPLNDQPFAAVTANQRRVFEQLETLGAFRKKLVVFSYFDYMSREEGGAAADLFDAYARYIDEKLARKARSRRQ